MGTKIQEFFFQKSRNKSFKKNSGTKSRSENFKNPGTTITKI
jgi:hypothetical protein